jgi:hypothetical protein
VLHQTKASKLQELILTGQIDMNKPLIEQPDAVSLQEQHKKMINDMLSPKSLNSTGSSGPQTSPTTDGGRLNRTSSPSQRSSTPQSSPLATMMTLEIISRKRILEEPPLLSSVMELQIAHYLELLLPNQMKMEVRLQRHKSCCLPLKLFHRCLKDCKKL